MFGFFAKPWDRCAPGAPRIALLAIMGLVVLSSAPGYCQENETTKPFEVPRATSEVVIDGVVDEQAWDDALILELRYEVRPGENIEPPVRTVGYVTFDEHHVLVAFKAYDPEPDKIRARYRDHDQVFGDDYVGITLDTFNDQRRAYQFWVNPLGVQLDAVYNDLESDFDRAWDGIWESAGRLTDFGYEVEFAIPFNQIRFQNLAGPQIWGLDLTRTYPRDNRYQMGLFPRERGANSLLAQEERIEGFAGVSPGRNLELVPTLTGFVHQERPDFPDSMETSEEKSLEPGVTGRWGITPNITLIGAINPDFSQVEADAVKLAINERFALFFEEKRPFFLESSDYFETGMNLLYTRMINDPIAALKTTGKMDANTFGLFAARDEITNVVVPGAQGSDSGSFESASNSLVGRYRYDIGLESAIGVLFTERQGEDGYFNRVGSLDGTFRPTSSDEISVNAAYSNTRYSGEMQEEFEVSAKEFGDYALTLKYKHTTRSWWVFSEFLDFGEGFRADLGFIPRVGFRQGTAGAGYILWGDSEHWYNRLEFSGFVGRTEDRNREQLADVALVSFGGEGPLQSHFRLELAERTEVYEGVRFENLFTPEFFLRMRPTASFSFRVRGTLGDWIDFTNVRPADRVQIHGSLDFNIGRHFELDLGHTYSILDVEGGRLFTANVSELKAVWQFTTRTFVRAIVQHTDISRDQDLYEDQVDTESRDFFVQLLFSYKVNPQTVFFFGYSEGGEENQDFPLTTIDRTLFLKIGYAWLW